MIRVSAIRVPARKFTAAELTAAFEAAQLGPVRLPGRAQVMDGHEVRGLFQSYLMMVGGRLAGADADVFEVPSTALPFVEAIQSAYRSLLDRESGFEIEVEDEA